MSQLFESEALQMSHKRKQLAHGLTEYHTSNTSRFLALILVSQVARPHHSDIDVTSPSPSSRAPKPLSIM